LLDMNDVVLTVGAGAGERVLLRGAELLNTSGPSVAAPGAQHATLGSNAVCLVTPVEPDREPLCVDMATGVVAAGKIRTAATLGQPIPDGWLQDAEGRPSTDPADFDAGGSIPLFGGYKGLGISLIAEIMAGALAGGRVSPDVAKQRKRPAQVMRCSQLLIGVAAGHFDVTGDRTQLARDHRPGPAVRRRTCLAGTPSALRRQVRPALGGRPGHVLRGRQQRDLGQALPRRRRVLQGRHRRRQQPGRVARAGGRPRPVPTRSRRGPPQRQGHPVGGDRGVERRDRASAADEPDRRRPQHQGERGRRHVAGAGREPLAGPRARGRPHHDPDTTTAQGEQVTTTNAGATIWFTGLPSSGKSTLAARLPGPVQVLDGDVLRADFFPELGFSQADRTENVRRTGRLALMLARHGVTVLVPVIPTATRGRGCAGSTPTRASVTPRCGWTRRSRSVWSVTSRACTPKRAAASWWA
jgi:hypothetical protein